MPRPLGTAFAIAILLIAAPLYAQLIDFETLPGGTATTDQQTISSEYASLGVTFSLLDPVTGVPIGSPRIAKVGPPATAFEGCYDSDAPYTYLGLGQSFLTDGNVVDLEGDLRIDFTTPVAQTSGVILDVDCRSNGGPPCEEWTITAYDSMDAIVDSFVVTGPTGPINPECASPGNGPGDSNALSWQFSVGSPIIKYLVFRYTGTAPTVGLGFDNFSVSALPAPLAISASVPADTVCAGETITLGAFPSGGSPPYAFQWQEQIAGSWYDLGMDQTQSVTVGATRDYRVIVTDAMNDEVMESATIVADADGLLCQTSLLVASFYHSRGVRYSFRSYQPEVFVASGSGGLSGASKIICGPDDNLYVSSQNDDRVRRFDGATGAFMDIFVTAGSGGLNLPVGLGFGPDGNLYVASAGNSSVLRYDGLTGAFIDAFVPNGSGLNNPTGLLWGPDDRLYVCSRNSDKVLHFDSDGTPLGDFVTAGSGGLDSPRGLTFGPDGNLYVGEEINDSVRRYDGTTGAFIDVFVSSGSGGLDRANDVAFGPDDVLYVASFNNSMLLGYDGTTGAFLGALPNDPLNGAAWIAVGCQPTATAVPENRPVSFALSIEPNVPNPFNPTTTAAFTLAGAGHARVTIVDVAGRTVATLLDRDLPKGRHVAKWNGRAADGGDVASGVYFIRVETAGRSAARKIVLLK